MATRKARIANRRLGAASKQVLFAIGTFNGAITKAQILRKIPHPSETGVPQAINRLRRDGYVKRTNGSGPGTVGTYRLTKKGQARLVEIKENAS